MARLKSVKLLRERITHWDEYPCSTPSLERYSAAQPRTVRRDIPRVPHARQVGTTLCPQRPTEWKILSWLKRYI
jgi:hypothetical protein